MDPNKIRIIVILSVLFIVLLFFTVGFSTKNHVTSRMELERRDICKQYRYGLFKVCVKDCRDSKFSNPNEDCTTIDYGNLLSDDNSHNTGRYAYLLMFTYGVSCLSLLMCLLPFFKAVSKYYLLVLITQYGIAGILGIIFVVLYAHSIIDTWMDYADAHGDTSVLASTAWSYSMVVASNIFMVITAGISLFIFRRYPDTMVCYERH